MYSKHARLPRDRVYNITNYHVTECTENKTDYHVTGCTVNTTDYHVTG